MPAFFIDLEIYEGPKSTPLLVGGNLIGGEPDRIRPPHPLIHYRTETAAYAIEYGDVILKLSPENLGELEKLIKRGRHYTLRGYPEGLPDFVEQIIMALEKRAKEDPDKAKDARKSIMDLEPSPIDLSLSM